MMDVNLFQVHPEILPYTEESARKRDVHTLAELEQLYSKEVRSHSWFGSRVDCRSMRIFKDVNFSSVIVSARSSNDMYGHQASNLHPAAL